MLFQKIRMTGPGRIQIRYHAGKTKPGMKPVSKAQEETVTEPLRKKIRVKGFYVILGAMAGTSNMDNLIDLVDRTELNTMVIDVKNDEGRVVYDMIPRLSEIGAVKICFRYAGADT